MKRNLYTHLLPPQLINAPTARTTQCHRRSKRGRAAGRSLGAERVLKNEQKMRQTGMSLEELEGTISGGVRKTVTCDTGAYGLTVLVFLFRA